MENLINSFRGVVALFIRALFPRKSLQEDGNETGVDAPGYTGVTKEVLGNLDVKARAAFEPESGDIRALGSL